MKNHFTMPSSLKHFCVLLLITLLSFSCEKDDSPNQETSISQPQEKGYTVKKVTLNEVKQSNLVKQAIDNIEQQLDYNKLNSTKSSKTKYQTNASTSAIATNDPIKNKDNTFTILTDEILQVSTDSTDVYTFRIETPTKPESDFENFVIHKNSDESIAYYIYRYESIGSEITALNFSREEVNSDQINIGDFDDYLPSVMRYDDANRCWVRVTIENGDLIIDTSDCRDRAYGGDGAIHVAGSGALTGFALSGASISYGTEFRFGNWINHGRISGGDQCFLSRALFDLDGNPLNTYQVTSVDCQDGSLPSNGNSPTDTDSSDPWGNSTNTWPNVDPLHSDSGGGGSPSNDSNTDNNTNQGDVVGVLAPSPLDLAIDAFFESLTDEQKDYLNPQWGEPHNNLKKELEDFFRNNKVVNEIGYDGALINEVLKNEAIMRIIAEMVNDISHTTSQWDFTKKGTYLDRDSLKYVAISDIPGTFGTEKMYLLENGLVLYVADGEKKINADSVSLPSKETSDEGYHYIYSYDTKKYYEYRLPPTDYPDADIDFLLDAFWTGTKIVARYATPIEDAIILIDGKDFDGVEQNKMIAGGMLLVSIVPGGKVLKPVTKIAKGTKAWKITAKVGDRTVKLTFKVIDGVVNFGSRSKLATIIKTTPLEEAHHIVPWNKLEHEVIQEAAYAGFHMNAEVNGRALKKFTALTGEGIHGNHPAYDKYVQKRLNDFIGETSEEAKEFLEDILIPELNEHIDDAIESTMNLNTYFRDVINPANGID